MNDFSRCNSIEKSFPRFYNILKNYDEINKCLLLNINVQRIQKGLKKWGILQYDLWLQIISSKARNGLPDSIQKDNINKLCSRKFQTC